MNSELTTTAAAMIAPKVLKGFRFRWLAYGAIAYWGLRMMSKRGIFPKQADAALDVIDRGVNVLKEQAGLRTQSPVAAAESIIHH